MKSICIQLNKSKSYKNIMVTAEIVYFGENGVLESKIIHQRTADFIEITKYIDPKIITSI